MRLTCPNCLAQYEIDGSLLPADGREVQCSACDTIWFQSAPLRKSARNAGQRGNAPTEPVPTQSGLAAPAAWPDTAAQAQADSDTDADDPLPPAPDTNSPARPRGLDPAVTDLLREEAAFEAAQRKRDAGPVETQPDLGLLGGNPWPAFRDPATTLLDTEHRFAPGNSGSSPASFPDIDDVSTTLDPLNAPRPSDVASYDLPMTAQDRQRSFLQGFIVPVALGGLVVGLYLAAPLLSALIPPAAPVLTGFTMAIDSGRAALAALILGQPNP